MSLLVQSRRALMIQPTPCTAHPSALPQDTPSEVTPRSTVSVQNIQLHLPSFHHAKVCHQPALLYKTPICTHTPLHAGTRPDNCCFYAMSQLPRLYHRYYLLIPELLNLVMFPIWGCRLKRQTMHPRLVCGVKNDLVAGSKKQVTVPSQSLPKWRWGIPQNQFPLRQILNREICTFEPLCRISRVYPKKRVRGKKPRICLAVFVYKHPRRYFFGLWSFLKRMR